MKHTTIAAVLFFALLLITGQGVFAQDTLVVYANGASIDAVINSDTTGTGTLKHKVYKLVSRDTVYLFEGTITVKNSIEILGVPDPVTGRPPCIQPAVLGNSTIPAVLFTMNGTGTQGVLRNLYLLGIATNNTVNYAGGQAIQISADSIRLTVDNVVFEQWSQFAIGYSGSWDKFFITNCKFRNMNTQPNQYYVGEVIRNENYLGSFATDSLIMKYNTIFCVGGYAAGPVVANNVMNAFEFSHNSVVFNFKNPFFIHRATNAKFNNNIFYCTYAGGMSLTEYTVGYDELTREIGSIFSFDTLSAHIDSLYDPADVANPNLRWLAEAKRTIEVMNNAYFWPAQITNYWTAWNDTAHVDSIVTPVFMNPRTTNMFGNKTLWPGFVESGNINANPTYGPSIDSVFFPGATTIDVGLLNWFAKVRQGSGTTEVWGYKITQVGTAANWVPPWPLPESADMQYTNTAVKNNSTDGLPLGDPWWFKNGPTGVKEAGPNGLPVQFALMQNYPNPFNPTTEIDYAIPFTAQVQLKVYNMLGQEVATLVNGEMKAGNHAVTFDASRISSGVYFYRLIAGTFVQSRKMLLVK